MKPGGTKKRHDASGCRREPWPAPYSPVGKRCSPVIPFFLPNLACALIRSRLFLPTLGTETGPREDTMAKPMISSKNLHAVAGAVLFSFGLTLLTANLDEVAGQVSSWLPSGVGSLGAVIEIGLAGLRAVEAYFFDPSAFQAGFLSILVSLWPLILVIIGAILLHDAIGARFASPKLARTFPSREYESES